MDLFQIFNNILQQLFHCQKYLNYNKNINQPEDELNK